MSSQYCYTQKASTPSTLVLRRLIILILPISTLLTFYFFLIPQLPFLNPLHTTTAATVRSRRLTTLDDNDLTHLHLAKSHCSGTLYTDLCVSTLTSIPNLHTKPLTEVISATIDLTVHEAESSASNLAHHTHPPLHHPPPPRHSHGRSFSAPAIPPILLRRALDDCVELLDDTIDELRTAEADLSAAGNGWVSGRVYAEVETMLSAAMTNQYTCLEGLGLGNKTLREEVVQPKLVVIARHVSNALAMLKKVGKKKKKKGTEKEGVSGGESSSSSGSLRRVTGGYGLRRDGFPRWMSSRDRNLLQTPLNETRPDVVVAKDGSGNFTTINEAVEFAPNKSETRFIIYIKSGAYFENVEVIKKKTMIMFLGDGIGKTVVKACRNVVDQWTTFRSATVAVTGHGFIAKGITIENYAGIEKHQAVAFRSGSDLSAFYQCSFVAYQDTLYVHSLRQFYRECDVYGTVDFIFGDATVVFQRSNLYARKPGPNQKNIVSAQGRRDPNQNTGISFLECKVAAAADLVPAQAEVKTFLGRPWREYSRTVYLRSYIGDHVDPAGWLEWSGDFALKTLFYGEYGNRGPGSNTSRRVGWPGYRVLNESEAMRFTVGNFIEGSDWLPGYEIPHYLNLTT